MFQASYFSTFTRTSEFLRAGSSVRQHGDRKSYSERRNGVHTVLESFSNHRPVVSGFIWVEKSPLTSNRKNPFWFWICRRISVVWAVFKKQFRCLKVTVIKVLKINRYLIDSHNAANGPSADADDNHDESEDRSARRFVATRTACYAAAACAEIRLLFDHFFLVLFYSCDTSAL